MFWKTSTTAEVAPVAIVDKNPGSSDFLTELEESLVEQLRPEVNQFLYLEYMHESGYLVRFLRARNYDVHKAKDMIEKAMIWRRKNKMDSILLDDFTLVENYYPAAIGGEDKHGHPLVIARMRDLDLRKGVESGHIELFLHFFDAMLELAESYMREFQSRPGRSHVQKVYCIFDMSGFNLRQHGCVQVLQYIPRVFTTYESYFTDRFFKLYAVNTPWIFGPIFELIRPFLSAPSQKAIHLFDSKADHWKQILLSDIAPDQLPVEYGGTNTDFVPQTFGTYKNTDVIVQSILQKVQKRANGNCC